MNVLFFTCNVRLDILCLFFRQLFRRLEEMLSGTDEGIFFFLLLFFSTDEKWKNHVVY